MGGAPTGRWVNGGTFTLIENDGGAAITGTFSGLPEGARVMVNNQPFRITYRGGTSGRDVVLRFEGLGLPGPEILALRRLPGNQVEIDLKWKPGARIRIERSLDGLLTWDVRANIILDAQGRATAQFQEIGGEGFFRAASY